eukprot:928071-Amphidinium_carterae.1
MFPRVATGFSIYVGARLGVSLCSSAEASITAQLPECKSSWQLSIACPVKETTPSSIQLEMFPNNRRLC